METYWNCSNRFHWLETNSKQRKHKIDLFHSYRIGFIHINDTNSHHNQDRQHKKNNIIEGVIEVK